MSTPVDRIQGVIRDWVPDDLLCKQDALAAIAELERERDSLGAELAATASDRDEIHRALLMTTDERNRGDRELHRLRAQLCDPVAVHVEMLRGKIAVPPLAELLHVYGATFSDLDAANVEIAKARAEAAKWERLHDELYAEIASEHRRDEYGETETAAECIRRVLCERDELRAKLTQAGGRNE